jgi:hypothetical protein
MSKIYYGSVFNLESWPSRTADRKYILDTEACARSGSSRNLEKLLNGSIYMWNVNIRIWRYIYFFHESSILGF